MSSRPESKTASQFATLTMKLKDKIHQQRNRYAERIKHTPSLRSKPPDLDLTEHTHKDKLGEQQRIVISSLQYFKALVDRFGVERVERVEQQPCVVGVMLGGASSTVLEEVHTLVQLEPRLHSSRSVSACLVRLHAAVADLIRWVDRVILQVVTAGDKESTGSVATVIKVVLDGVKELVRLAAERKEGAAPVSPVQSQPAVELLTCPPAEEDEPPPKPVMPLLEHRHSLTPPQTFSPPALPPKKRSSSSGPAPCRVAIVAPMRRETEAERQECEEDDLKSCSSSSADSGADNTHCGVQLTMEEDPDYDFLHTDLSSSETLPPLPPPSSLPPTLPEKRRRSAAEASSSQSSPAFEFGPAHQEQSPAHSDDVTDPESLSSPLSPSKSPPPLPEKKRHIHQYLQFCSSYSAQSAAMFYSRPSGHSQRHSTKRPTHTHQDPDSASAPEPVPAPALPPKKRQQDADEDDEESEEQLIGDGSHGLQQEEEQEEREEHEEQQEQQEEVLLKKKEILHRIIMTPEGEHDDGPDVKAASPDILLAYAAETESSTEPGYREAFLYTYRCFISPSDVISKLQHRYRHLKDGAEPEQENAFNLLVSVVDQLSAVELEPDLLLLLMDLVFSLLIGGELTQARQLRSVILSKMEHKWQLIGCPQSLQPLASRGVAARPGTLLDFRSHDLAEQLTLRDSELFYKIELQEVLLWSKEQNEEKSPNLTAFTQHFNNVSFWVRSVIMLQDKPHDREKLLLKFLKIMKHLRRLNNFNSYLSILSGLDSAPLRRLDWQRNTAESLEEYSSLIDSSSSFRAYRAALHEADPPCIPYLGLILQDLTFVHLGNPDKLMTPQGSKVNFSKNWQQFNILETLRTYQQTRYQLQANDDITSFFNEFRDHLAEEALWELSLRLRPRSAPRANHK
ncbi:rap guanine nucleotide exchange factor 1-like [Scomber japonicus]|uniref:rap guanine nucleotide exchange factor 1-like n=1 Tax=Scomber japonicus TaxID=13676 RepID=UPI0023050C8F|nr:rap guanine nucleotide exchange factor 1-like [Scomber japonicus]